MISTLNYAVTFSNEKKITRDLQFELQGSTLITGRNEAGKSLNLEMISYSLFGNEALRGKLTDYKRLSCKSKLIIKGQQYLIERVKSNAKLFKVVEGADPEPMATGISPVNNAIVELLGFDYAVYRIAHLAAQGDLQALANMKPTERKKMVDTVAGLNQLDDVASELDMERKELRGKISGMEALLTEPEKPQAPTTDRKVLEANASALDVKNSERQKLNVIQMPTKAQAIAFMEQLILPVLPEVPTLPEAPAAPLSPEDWSVETYAQLQEIKGQIGAADGAVARASALMAPELTADDIHFHRALNLQNKRIEERDTLRHQGYVVCSECGHENFLAANLLEEKYSDLPEVAAEASTYTETQLVRVESQIETYQKAQAEKVAAESQLVNFGPLRHVIPVWEEYAGQLTQYTTTRSNWEDRCNDIHAAHQQALARYEQDAVRVQQHNAQVDSHNSQAEQRNREAEDLYQTALVGYQDAQEKLKAFVDLDEQRQQVQNSLEQWRFYDARFEAYQLNLETYNGQMAQVVELKVQLEDLDRARKALNETKTNVKSYLTPALSRVASVLLSDMTGGERNTIVVDEDFEVLVDDQPLRTLSGSGKDIANLAIRLALGQVLTHNVLPMVCLDEVDQGCDSDRARYIQECLQRITPQIGQMLIVSHKPTVADHTIAL